jgi:hypothetical protein
MKFRLATLVIIILFIAAALLVFFTPFIAHSQPTSSIPTMDAPGYAPHIITPAVVEQHLYAWGAGLMIIGGFIRHYVGGFIVWLTPWGKSHGGIFRGIRNWFWDSSWKPPTPLPISGGTKPPG